MTPHELEPASLLQTLAAVSANIAIAIVLGGVVSGIVALGFLQLGGRRRIQKRVVGTFLRDVASRSVSRPLTLFDYLGLGTKTSGFRMGLDTAQELLRLSPDALCGLYYRQICGQFLAVINSETSRSEYSPGDLSSRTAPLTYYLTNQFDSSPTASSADSSLSSSVALAMRRVDELQVLLGDAVNGWVTRIVALAWIVFYTIAGIAIQDRNGGLLGFIEWAGAVASASVVAFVMGLATAACSLVVFSAVDRFHASR